MGGLPPDKPRGLRGGPAQRQRTEVVVVVVVVVSHIQRIGCQPEWVAFGVVVKVGRDWMTAAKIVGKWHRGVERGAEALDSAWRRADLRQSNVQRQREVSEVVH